jgi:hypothetical protein
LIREDNEPGRSSILNAVLIVLAVIGAVAVMGAVVGAFGMWAMHTGMMNGIGSCQGW